jgi:hypothetical protein
MADNGTPASLIDAFFCFFSVGGFDDSAVTTTVHEITGRSPRTFDHWAHAHANLFGEPPAAAYLVLMDDRYRSTGRPSVGPPGLLLPRCPA